jgi:hypothetical protein
MFFRTTGVALTVVLTGCSGVTGLVNADAGAAPDSALSADVAAPIEADPADGGGAPVSTKSRDAASPDSSGPVGSGVADASPESATSGGGCDNFPVLTDGGFGTCAFTPADLACTTQNDCRAFEFPACDCGPVPVIGVNRAAAVVCPAPHCPPSGADSGCFGGPSGYQGQDCAVVSSPAEIVVDCVNGQCVSQAASPGH